MTETDGKTIQTEDVALKAETEEQSPDALSETEADNTYEETAQILAAVGRFQEKQRENAGQVILREKKVSSGEQKTEGAADDPEHAPDKNKQELIPQRVICDLVAIYLIYVIYTLIKTLRAGEVKENHVVWVIFAIVLFAAGVIWLILPEIRKLFKKKEP